MVNFITVKVIIHESRVLKMCFKLNFCSGIEQIACNCLGFWLCFLTVVSITEDVETDCCRFCGTVEPHGFEVQDRSSGMHFDSSTESLAMTFINA